ncbi:MAG: hypothetical protein OIF58_13895 [Cohaesibacter sp.]|nr:hypothetical protein [Cohaesibacter sp.]
MAPSTKAEKALPRGRTTAISPAGPELAVFSTLSPRSGLLGVLLR